MTPRPSFAGLFAASLLVASCGVSTDADNNTHDDDEQYIGASPRLLRLDIAAIEASNRIEINVGEDAISLLLELALQDSENSIGLVGVTAPDGTRVHDSPFEADSWEATRFASEIFTEPLADQGDIALTLPVSPTRPLTSGRWVFEIVRDPADAELAYANATVRDDPDGVVADEARHLFDLHVHVIHPDTRYRSDAFPTVLDTEWRAALDAVLAPHALGVGVTTVSVASLRQTARLAELDDEREIASACRDIRRAGSPGALHVGLVATIKGDLVSGEGLDDHPDDDAMPLTGLSPQPGLHYDDESPNACVFVAEQPWREGYDPGKEPTEKTIIELLAANLLHEMGHFTGLAHPSEADGVTFDLLDDTPKCAAADPELCGPEGGANNLMFLAGDESTLPWTLTADQAWVLRRHPLFRPAVQR